MSDLISIIVVPTAWGGRLRSSIASAVGQSYVPVEIVFVDTGRADPPARPFVASLKAHGVRVVDTKRVRPGAVRNAGVLAASGDLLVCVEEGDTLRAGFCEDARRALDSNPNLGFVLAPGVTEPGDEPLVPELPIDFDTRTLLGTTWCAPAALLFRRALWNAAAGFDEELDSLEHYDFLLRVVQAGGRGVVLDRPALRHAAARDARYRHDLDEARYRAGLAAVFDRHRAALDADPAAVLFEREKTLRQLVRLHTRRVERRDDTLSRLRHVTHQVGAHRAWLQQERRDGLDWGDLRRTSPVSRDWGYDRGTPVDRYYIEQFVQRHAADVRGVVLEVQENDLTTRCGGNRVTRSDVIDLNPGNARATIVDDLRRALTVADDTYDCVILTQTLHVIDDMRQVLTECRRILKPGGVLLATLPSASRVSLEYGPRGDFWRVTEAGARALFEAVFPPNHVQTRAFGNVRVNAAFLYGLACHELDADTFDTHDPYLPLLVGVRAVKPDVIDTARGPLGRAPRQAGPPRGVILMYHRVAEATPDVHGLSVRPDDFARQMAVLRQHFRPMPLADLVEAVRRGALPEGAAAVTFDDGYVDGLANARPILEAQNIPATFFLTTERLDTEHEYWWDMLERVLLGSHVLPPSLGLKLAGVTLAQNTGTPQERREAYWICYRLLSDAGVDAREAALERLLDWSQAGRVPRPEARPMTAREVRRLAENPAFSIGAHGVHHLRLPKLAGDLQRAEIAECKRTLENVLGREITSFAYPYGHWSHEAARSVQESGFALAVTCDERPVEPGDSPWLLPRFDVRPDVGAHFARRIFALLDRRN